MDEREWLYSGVVDHVLTLQKAQEVTEGVEEALQKLKNNMASIKQEEEAKR